MLEKLAGLKTPDSAAMMTRAQGNLSLVEAMVIESQEDYEMAGDTLRVLSGRGKELVEMRMGITRPIDEAKAAVMNLFRVPTETVDKAIGILKAKMLAYNSKVEAAVAAERKAAQEAAEAQRMELVRQAEEVQRKANDEAAKASSTAAANEIMQQGSEAAARALSEAAVVTSAPPAVAKATAAGTAVRTTVKFDVLNMEMLIKHVAEHPELAGLLRPDDVKLRAYVKGLGMACKLPGVHVYEERNMSARAA